MIFILIVIIVEMHNTVTCVGIRVGLACDIRNYI